MSFIYIRKRTKMSQNEDFENGGIPVLDSSVWKILQSSNVSSAFTDFVDITDFTAERCFVATKFHIYFTGLLVQLREGTERMERIVGVQGIGKSSSALYYVLSCIKNEDKDIHYIDLNMIENSDKVLQRLNCLVTDTEHLDCLIIDHWTLFNETLLKNVEKMVRVKKIILIESGFTACIHRGLNLGKRYQLDEEDFKNIWIGSLNNLERNHLHIEERQQIHNLKELADDVYLQFKDDYILTPLLLHRVQNQMFVLHKNLLQASFSYLFSVRGEIAQLYVDDENELHVYDDCILHTKALLNFLCSDSVIFTPDSFSELKVAINIFDFEFCKVQKYDMEHNVRFMELGLREGDTYVKISHLMPKLSEFWRQRFPFELGEIIKDKNCTSLFDICFRYSGVQREIVKCLVTCQKDKDLIIIPEYCVETSCIIQEACSKHDIKQCNGVVLSRQVTFCKPNLQDLSQVFVSEKYTFHEKNVAGCAEWLKEKIVQNHRNSILVHPAVQNIMGIDYLVYTQKCVPDKDEKKPTKKFKSDYVLFLAQVAFGSVHPGSAIGRAIKIFQDILKDITVHGIILIASNEKDSYILTGDCSFRNISVINMLSPPIHMCFVNEINLLGRLIDNLTHKN